MSSTKISDRRHLDADARKLVTDNYKLVYAVAKDFARPGDCEYDDLISDGNLALFKAAQKFDPANGVPFAGYARVVIKRAMIKCATREAQHTVGTDDDVANKMFIAETDRVADQAVDALAELADASAAAMAGSTAKGLLTRLSARERQVIDGRYSLGKTQSEIGAEMGISYQAVQQIEARALARMRVCDSCAIEGSGRQCVGCRRIRGAVQELFREAKRQLPNRDTGFTQREKKWMGRPWRNPDGWWLD